MLNYKKIYKRFVQEIKKNLKSEKSCPSMEDTERGHLLDAIESRYAISVLECILSYTEELEGKKCSMSLMNQKEFTKWKKHIQKKIRQIHRN